MYQDEIIDSLETASGREVVETVREWADYVRRASAHAAEHHGLATHAENAARLAGHVKLAAVFVQKVAYWRPDPAWVIVTIRRDGGIGALAIINARVVESSMYLNDLWTNPRKAYRITDRDRIPGEDLSGQAMMEYLIRDTYRRGWELELLAGDTIARRWYSSKFGFGVRTPKPSDPVGLAMDYSEHQCVWVNPRLGTTEREMYLPRDRQAQFLAKHGGSSALIPSVPAPFAASCSTAVSAFPATAYSAPTG
jgi:hypothetical protein